MVTMQKKQSTGPLSMCGGGEFTPFAFERVDKSKASAFGSNKALILFDGVRLPSVIQSDEKAPAAQGLKGDAIDSIFAGAKKDAGSSTVAQWRGFAGPLFTPASESEECSECNGSGTSECPTCEQECKCQECDGSGTIETETEWPDRPYVKVNGSTFDARLLAPLLSMVPDGAVSVGVQEASPNRLVLIGDGWKIVAMTVHAGSGDKSIPFIPEGTS